MGIAGPTGPTEKRRAELIGGLFLVGARGKCCAVITERQLTIERFDGKGIRLDLAAIERMRHLKIPMLPSGIVLLGVILIYLGITTIVAPMSWLAVGLGSTAIIANIVSRYSILAIETGSGDRHLVSGSEANLLKLCLIVDRVRHGSEIQEALLGLENLETELPTFPAIRDVTGQLGRPALAALPVTSETNEIGKGRESYESVPRVLTEPDLDIFDTSLLSENAPLMREGPSEIGLPDANSMSQNAYERAWGVQEAPTWYKEKVPDSREENRIDSAFSDAAEDLEMFSPGGLFDSNQIPEGSDNNGMDLFDFGFHSQNEDPVEKSQSSAQMIKRANQEFGMPTEPFPRSLLPPPTEEAVREECRAGVVRQAKARQELRTKSLDEFGVMQAANLDDYPALKDLASTMGGRKSGARSKGVVSGGWLSRLLRPGSSIGKNSDSDIESSNEIETEKFQSTQYMRLRSDQDHQADVSSRLKGMRNNSHSYTARDKLDSIVSRLSGEEESPRNLLDESNNSLKFNQLKPTSSKEDPHPLPGVRRLG
jgi:hypothetical protein